MDILVLANSWISQAHNGFVKSCNNLNPTEGLNSKGTIWVHKWSNIDSKTHVQITFHLSHIVRETSSVSCDDDSNLLNRGDIIDRF